MLLLSFLLAVIGLISAYVEDSCAQYDGTYCLYGEVDNIKVEYTDSLDDQKCKIVARYIYGMDGEKTDRLWIDAREGSFKSDEEIAYNAGYIEGYITACAISNHFENVKKDFCITDKENPDKTEFDPKLVDYSNGQIEYIQNMYKKHSDDIWWKQAYLMISQLRGLANGYKDNEERTNQEFDDYFLPFYYINMAGEYDDLPGWFYPDVQSSPSYNPDLNEHCTASVIFNKKIHGKGRDENDLPDIYFSQDTWSGYQNLYRIMKSYKLPYSGVNSQHIIFSSYPIMLFSMDDIYILSNKLAVYETTFHTWTTSLYDKYLKERSVPTWIRVQVANRLAKDGVTWARNFRKFNSGTYNNQYVILDYNRFEKYLDQYKADKSNAKLLKNTAYIVEMGPGMSFAYDATGDLEDPKLGYIPGINTPRPKLMFAYQGYPSEQSDSVKGYWGYETSVRYKLFEKYVKGINDPDEENKNLMVVDYESFKKFKRYNNYNNEDAANNMYSPNCTDEERNEHGKIYCEEEEYHEPGFAILSRYDLRKDRKHGPSAFGGLDAKTTNYDKVKNMKFDIKPCPVSSEDEGNPDIPYWSFENWNEVHKDSVVTTHGLETGNYTCDWITMTGEPEEQDIPDVQ